MYQLENYKYTPVWEYKGLDMGVSFFLITIVCYVILTIHNLHLMLIYVLINRLLIKTVKLAQLLVI